jgi:hypothetical protein
MNDEQWKIEDEQIKSEYEKAYEHFVHCSEEEAVEAGEKLDYWRHRWFNH